MLRDFWEHRNDPDVAMLIFAVVFTLGLMAMPVAEALGWI